MAARSSDEDELERGLNQVAAQREAVRLAAEASDRLELKAAAARQAQVAGLSAREAEVLWLAKVEHKEHREIADRLGFAQATSRSTLSHAMSKLRRMV
jgi:DNA-binding CsgD family transcriptional regulator